MRHSEIGAAAVAIALCLPSLPGQVVISEVEFTAGSQWIELLNRGNASVDLSGWSIYHATKTANRPNDYWWPIPTGTMTTSSVTPLLRRSGE